MERQAARGRADDARNTPNRDAARTRESAIDERARPGGRGLARRARRSLTSVDTMDGEVGALLGPAARRRAADRRRSSSAQRGSVGELHGALLNARPASALPAAEPPQIERAASASRVGRAATGARAAAAAVGLPRRPRSRPPSPRGSPQAGRRRHADIDKARLVAVNMALGGVRAARRRHAD